MISFVSANLLLALPLSNGLPVTPFAFMVAFHYRLSECRKNY